MIDEKNARAFLDLLLNYVVTYLGYLLLLLPVCFGFCFVLLGSASFGFDAQLISLMRFIPGANPLSETGSASLGLIDMFQLYLGVAFVFSLFVGVVKWVLKSVFRVDSELGFRQRFLLLGGVYSGSWLLGCLGVLFGGSGLSMVFILGFFYLVGLVPLGLYVFITQSDERSLRVNAFKLP